jgi:hypothetical protein
MRASIGTVGNAYDALAESTIGLFKTELIRRRWPWRTLDDVEIATLEWVGWFNNRRLHTELGDIPPADHETAYYRQINASTTLEPRNRASTEPGTRQRPRGPAGLHRVPGAALEEGLVDQHLERLNKEVKRRADVVGVFPNPAALLRLAGAVLVEAHDEWAATDRRYLSERSMAQLAT